MPGRTVADVDAAVTSVTGPVQLAHAAQGAACLRHRHPRCTRGAQGRAGTSRDRRSRTPTKIADMIQVGIALIDLRQMVLSAKDIEWEERAGHVGVEWVHHPLELPASSDHCKDRRCARRRMHNRAYGCRGRASVWSSVRRSRERGWTADRGLQPCAWNGRDGGSNRCPPGAHLISFTGRTDVGKRVLESDI